MIVIIITIIHLFCNPKKCLFFSHFSLFNKKILYTAIFFKKTAYLSQKCQLLFFVFFHFFLLSYEFQPYHTFLALFPHFSSQFAQKSTVCKHMPAHRSLYTNLHYQCSVFILYKNKNSLLRQSICIYIYNTVRTFFRFTLEFMAEYLPCCISRNNCRRIRANF